MAWIEQRNDIARLRIDTGDVRPFGQIAFKAAKSEVSENRRTSVLFGDDVVDLKSLGIIRLWNSAVFTPVASAPSHRVS
jgi:hypothetical protein